MRGYPPLTKASAKASRSSWWHRQKMGMVGYRSWTYARRAPVRAEGPTPTSRFSPTQPGPSRNWGGRLRDHRRRGEAEIPPAPEGKPAGGGRGRSVHGTLEPAWHGAGLAVSPAPRPLQINARKMVPCRRCCNRQRGSRSNRRPSPSSRLHSTARKSSSYGGPFP